MAIKRKIKAKAKAPAIRKPSTAPIDAVRNPNFDAAMAQRNYDNFIAEQRARLAAGQGQGGAPLTQSEIDKKYVDDGRGGRVLNPVDAAKVKSQFDQLRANIAANPGPARNFDIDYIEGGQRNAPINQGSQVGTGGQDFIDSRDPNKMYTQDMVDYIDPATGERTSRTRGVVPAPGSRFVPANKAGGLAYNQIPPMNTGGTALPQDFSKLAPSYDVSKLIADYQAQRDAPRLMPIQTPGSNALNQDLANRGMGGGIPTPIPQGQQGAMASQYQNPAMNQMADYNKMLQQGMQRNQDMNQAAQNFAGMGGPQRSFSQVVGGINRMNRAPKPPRNRSLAPSNQKLI